MHIWSRKVTYFRRKNNGNYIKSSSSTYTPDVIKIILAQKLPQYTASALTSL